MSRIAGIYAHSDARNWAAQLVGMCDVLRSDSRWQSRSEAIGKAGFASTGWRPPNLACANGVLAVMDGCIYNKDELGDASCDAELLLRLYARHGFEAALRKINGDFAVAVYDSATDTAWLARDRFGIKPLYYTTNPERFAFASRPRALLRLSGVSTEVNRRYVGLFAGCHYRYFDNDREASPYADIAQLPAATMLCLRKGSLTTAAYWALEDLPDFTASEADLAGTYRELINDAVSLRLKSARRPIFTLSGGMDSSSVLASAVRITGSRQHAVSTVYADETYDESTEIASMLDSTVEQWHRIEVDPPDVFALIPQMIAAHDEPVATATWLSHYVLCEEVSQRGFGGVFGGLGGDELNAGEYEYFLYHFADLQAAGEEQLLQREVKMWMRHHDHPIFRKSHAVVAEGMSDLVDLSTPGRCLPDRRRLTRYASALNPEYFDLEAFEPVMDHPFAGYLKNRTYQDIYREPTPSCLRAEDRQTAAFGLDNFLPFYDHRLSEFMYRVPGNLKIRDGVTKVLLREAMRGILPEETRTRTKKTGWNAPAHLWFSGAGREPLLDMVHSRAFRERGIYNVAEVERLIDDHERIVSSGATEDTHMMFLWQLVNLELWLSSLAGNQAREA